MGEARYFYKMVRFTQVLNEKLYEHISPRTLACWFMDDGGVAIHMVFNSIHKVLAILK